MSFKDAAKEGKFRAWYKKRVTDRGFAPNPDDPKHKYDYRAAYDAGVEPGEDGHWPSRFKADDHPNRFVDGMDTKYNRPHTRSTMVSKETR